MEWRLKHELTSGHLSLSAPLVDVTAVHVMKKLEPPIAALLKKHGFKSLTQSVLQCEEREITQRISRLLFEQKQSGILFRSKIDGKRCASLFEGRAVRVMPYGPVQPLSRDFRLFREVCDDLAIAL